MSKVRHGQLESIRETDMICKNKNDIGNMAIREMQRMEFKTIMTKDTHVFVF